MLISGFTLTVNRYDPDDIDQFGNRGDPETHTIDNCVCAPAGSTERTGDQVLTIEKDTVYAPFEADVLPTDELVMPAGQPIEAGVYQVDGKPENWPYPFDGSGAGTLIHLTRATS